VKENWDANSAEEGVLGRGTLMRMGGLVDTVVIGVVAVVLDTVGAGSEDAPVAVAVARVVVAVVVAPTDAGEVVAAAAA
jgi:hypothetical protein